MGRALRVRAMVSRRTSVGRCRDVDHPWRRSGPIGAGRRNRRCVRREPPDFRPGVAVGGIAQEVSTFWTHENIALLGHAAMVVATVLMVIIALWATHYVTRLMDSNITPVLHQRHAS